MSTFVGIVTFDDAAREKFNEVRLAAAIGASRNEPPAAWRLENALFVQRAIAAPGGKRRGGMHPVLGRSGRSLFAGIARLDNRDELRAALGLPSSDPLATSDPTLVLHTLERWGEAGIARCLGAFAFALWDADARRLILGRDCLGNRALFFYRGRDFVAFASTLRALLALPGVPRELDEIVLANFLALNLAESRRTFYRGIERVPSRTMVTIGRAGIDRQHYWSPDFNAPPPYRREQDYVERARELFDQAVATATVDTPHVAVSTSGGFDSSAIAATAARLGRAESITCYSLVPPAGTLIDVGPGKYIDERPKVEALARMHPQLDLHFISPDRPHALEMDDSLYFARASIPTLSPSALGLFSFLYEAVEHDGHSALLVGVLGNFGLTWKGSFSLLSLLTSGQWSGFARELSASAKDSNRSLFRAFAAEVIMQGAPSGLRDAIHRFRGRDPYDIARFSVLRPEFIAECSLDRLWREQEFDPWMALRNLSPAHYRAHYLFDHGQFARDGKSIFSEHRGLERHDPHGDRRLLEFLLAVPEPMYRRNGVPRSFARRVLADRLPREILDERRHGMQGANWFNRLALRRVDIDADVERLDASPLARRLLDVPRLKRLLDEWPQDEHAAEKRQFEYRLALTRGVHIGRFIRWVEGGNQ